MKKSFKYIAYVVGGASFAYLLFMSLVSSYTYSSSSETWEKMHKSSFPCPPGTEVTYRGWSKNGNLRYCEPAKDGPWEAWMSGYKHIEGSYSKGKKNGTWRWFDKNGEVTKTVEYVNGEEI